ncbi:MAG: hypothetical protein JWQ98_252 [Chlorobi bacterium]|nr:hypothetical protein [Chlorobiota bacterium]
MDETFCAGDIITYRLNTDNYGIARILHVEELALHNHYHLAILDAVLSDQDGVDSYGVHAASEENAEAAGEAPVFIDHIALMPEAFAESGPVLLDSRPVEDDELDGYGLWLDATRENLIRTGMIRQYEEELEDDAMFDQVDEDQPVEDETDAGDEETESESVADDSGGELPEIERKPWHSGVYSRPLAGVMFDAEFRMEFVKPEMKDAAVARFINSFFDESNMDTINEMVQSLIDGDYGAGQELVAFGDVAAAALGNQLQGAIPEQLADDILNILCDMGTMRAYELIATFFMNHSGPLADDLGLPAARGFCYAVMLTGGTPEPLHRHLDRLDDILYPELSHDVASARDAVANAAAMFGS